MKVKVLVTIYLNHPVGVMELRYYVKDAVETWNGQLHPEDPLRTGIKSVSTRLVKDDK
jgi:hypothetical protein